MTSDRGKQLFRRWIERLPEKSRLLGEQVVSEIVPVFEKAGFESVTRQFDVGKVRANEIALERKEPDGSKSFVVIVFDKNGRQQFQVHGGTKKIDATKTGWDWVKSGYLVWKRREDVRYKMWGVTKWPFGQWHSNELLISSVTKIAPQLVYYLNEGIAGQNILTE